LYRSTNCRACDYSGNGCNVSNLEENVLLQPINANLRQVSRQ
jgi:hypothetical protein